MLISFWFIFKYLRAIHSSFDSIARAETRRTHDFATNNKVVSDRTISPEINADPRINRSLFRINRDTRFSRDKRPYKTQLAIWFWEGTGKRLECLGYYFQLEPGKLMLGVGIYCFSRPLLERYRELVTHKQYGAALTRAIREVKSRSDYIFGGKHYKRAPRGYDPDHVNADLLRYNGLYAEQETPIPKELFSADLLDYCFERYLDMSPPHSWLLNVTE